jgi:hypothetical protein
MSFRGGPKIFFDPDVQLAWTYSEPAAAACTQKLGLFDLLKSQK